jgi:TM2 domain-containing membrane protein YozV
MPQNSPSALISKRRYGVAVALSSVFGVLGLHHFYLGRPGLGLLDLGMSIAAFGLLVFGEIELGVLVLLADFAHGIYETVRLVTGGYRDGAGAVVAYPGQVVTRREPS